MASYQCIKCGYTCTGQSGTPSPGFEGPCSDTSSGNHVWQLVSRFSKILLNFSKK